MHVAIVIPAFNIAPYLRDAVVSVLDQTHTDWSMVVIDDGSTDATAAVARCFPHPRIRVIQQPNAGVSAARNAGIITALTPSAADAAPRMPSWPGARYACPGHPRFIGRCADGRDARSRRPALTISQDSHSAAPGMTPTGDRIDTRAGLFVSWPREQACEQGSTTAAPDVATLQRAASKPNAWTMPDAFLFLDGDDWLAPDALARLADTLQTAPWAVAASGRFARVSQDNAAHLSASPPQGCLLERLLTRNLFANGGHLLVRREAVEASSGFRDDLTFGEDWEYWTRLALQGEFVAVPSPAPVLFVRERSGSACASRATDPTAYTHAMNAIHRNPAIAARIDPARRILLARRAQAEMAWAIGRELIRHGRQRDGLHWLSLSIRDAPSLKRLILMGLSRTRQRPFRPYPTPG